MGLSLSTAKCALTQGAMRAAVEIVDTTMNPLMAMPFNMARAMQVDSSSERMGPINFGEFPGTQSYKKQAQRAEVMVMVRNRVLINVRVEGAGSEAPAVGLAQYVNLPPRQAGDVRESLSGVEAKQDYAAPLIATGPQDRTELRQRERSPLLLLLLHEPNPAEDVLTHEPVQKRPLPCTAKDTKVPVDRDTTHAL